MASRRGERVLESRHLIGLFLGVVLLCCVFFTLGYVMGKTQYANSPVQAASLDTAPKPSPRLTNPVNTQPATSTEWDFYTDKKTTDVPLKPSRTAESAAANSEAVQSVWPASSAQSAPAARSLSPSANVPAIRQQSSPRSRASRSFVSAVPSRFRAPRMSHNAIVLQVGALRHESDALTMADALQRRGYPAFVTVPKSDAFYRVQVGPFPTQTIGNRAKQSLLREGFKAIYRR